MGGASCQHDGLLSSLNSSACAGRKLQDLLTDLT